MRVFVTGGAGFIGWPSSRRLRARGDEVVAIVRDPATAAAAARPRGGRSSPGDLRPGRDSRRPCAARTRRSTWPAPIGSGSRLASGRRCRMPTWARPTRVLDAADRGRRPADRLRLDGQRLRQHPRPDRRRDVPARPRRTGSSATTTRRSTSPTSRPRRGSRPARRSSSSMPGTVYGPGDHSAVGAQLARRYDGTAAVHRPRRRRASRRSTSTTSPAGSSRRSIAGGSARRTSSPATACACATRSRSRPRRRATAAAPADPDAAPARRCAVSRPRAARACPRTCARSSQRRTA